MKLADIPRWSMVEARTCSIVEDALRWDFDYANPGQDSHPDILVLGQYTNPDTGNHLIGGVNLHYLSDALQDKLAKALPTIMRSRNLQDRYRTGKRLIPQIFKNFYRTYRSDYIDKLSSGKMPKAGIVRRVGQWLKDWWAKLRDKENQLTVDPDTDLEQLGAELQQRAVSQPIPPSELTQATAELGRAQQQRAASLDAAADYATQPQPQQQPPDIVQPPTQPEPEPEPEPELQPEPDLQAQAQQVQQPVQQIQTFEEPTAAELSDEEAVEELEQAAEPEPELNSDDDWDDLLRAESLDFVSYYSPIHGRVLVEAI